MQQDQGDQEDQGASASGPGSQASPGAATASPPNGFDPSRNDDACYLEACRDLVSGNWRPNKKVYLDLLETAERLLLTRVGGWREHDGGDMPAHLHPDDKIMISVRGGNCAYVQGFPASHYKWPHLGFSGDIIAYMVVQPARTEACHPLRLCGYCHSWNSRPCGEQCVLQPTDPLWEELTSDSGRLPKGEAGTAECEASQSGPKGIAQTDLPPSDQPHDPA